MHLLQGRGAEGGWRLGDHVGDADAFVFHHPMWAVRFEVSGGPGGLAYAQCLVDAVSAKAHMVIDPQLTAAVLDAVAAAARGTAQTAVPHRPPEVSAADAIEAARAVAATSIRRRVKLAFPFSLDLSDAPTMVLKPNWLVYVQGAEASAEFLLDGLDGTHYVIEFRKGA